MILRHIRRRHQQCRTAEHAQLTEGSCTCAAHDQVSRRHAVGHVVDVLGHFDVRVRVKVGALLLRHPGQPLTGRRTGCVNMVIGHAVFALERQLTRHVLIHVLCTHRAPEGYDQLVIIGQAELLACLYAVRRQNLTAHRRTGQNDLISAAEQLLCLFKANEYAVRVLCEHLRYLAGQRVDLEQHGRNAELLCRAYHRERCIAAAADHAVRLGLLQQLFRLADRRDSQLCRLQIVQNALRAHRARHADDLDGVQRVSLTRDQLIFNAACRTGKTHRRLRLLFFKIACNGKTRCNVTARAASRNVQFQN